MYEHILIPTDGSDTANVAVEHAVDLAAKYGAQLHALYVVDIDAVSFGLGTEQVDRITQGNFGEMTELQEKAERATGTVVSTAAEHDVDVHEEVRVGTPHKVIADYAEDNEVDVIVMGSHGRSGVRRALLGSVTERVLRSTHIPVFVVDERRE
ncbi:Nucleotide-binding universal stress protein, UspA family [Halogranum amylolyticum]|uniref:Nucleotide-binding universal stress protein, UspA family n=1 Tax=Halogranum amylolyticum TaxID=660520 RepID=A0A1H8UTJ7_9EURY|nr:universal stress protein [Halogranum amylolyticum]SEP05898.1 Nucleotide-binding universal stress protein, UspA family [Halogranum amylolyticum]